MAKVHGNQTYPGRFCRPTSDLVKSIPEINVLFGCADMSFNTEL
jgi:hypothetical protein